MAETESQLQIEIDLKRVKSVPPSQLVSATETEDENNFSKSDSTFCNDKESYEKVLSKKLDNLKKCETGKFNKKKSFDNKINDLIKSSEQHEKNIQKNESAASIGESDTLFVDMQNIMDSSQDLFIEYSKDESDKDCKLSKKNYKIAEKNKENDEPLMKSNKLDNTMKACEKEKMHLESEVEHLKKEIKSLKKENKEKGKKMDSLKQKLNEQIKRTAEYEDLNKKLQKILIDKSEEKDSLV